jgi:sialic acid synthase SpsE
MDIKIIAEIGNCHFGDIERFRDLVFSAKDCGASIVKSQVGVSSGSMDASFYKKCDLGFNVYRDLIKWARTTVGIELFFTIFADHYNGLSLYQDYFKISGSQAAEIDDFSRYDGQHFFISLREQTMYPRLRYATPMYVTKYLEEKPDLTNLDRMKTYYGRSVGYSDHTTDVKNVIDAVNVHKACAIEKHFCLVKNEKYNGTVFRDTVHGFTPKEFTYFTKNIF